MPKNCTSQFVGVLPNRVTDRSFRPWVRRTDRTPESAGYNATDQDVHSSSVWSTDVRSTSNSGRKADIGRSRKRAPTRRRRNVANRGSGASANKMTGASPCARRPRTKAARSNAQSCFGRKAGHAARAAALRLKWFSSPSASVSTPQRSQR
jgi:hypothetical protein